MANSASSVVLGDAVTLANPYAPPGGTLNISGSIAASVNVVADGLMATSADGMRIKNSSGTSTLFIDSFGGISPDANFDTGLYMATGDLQFSEGANQLIELNSNGIRLQARTSDGPAAIAHTFNTATNLSTSGALLIGIENNLILKTTVNKDGGVTAGADVPGAVPLSCLLKGSYVIDFGAFTPGVNQTSAQALTGVAFGDCLSVGTSRDQSATIGQLSAQVTSAGNIVVIASPISATDTGNPASATYTVIALRS